MKYKSLRKTCKNTLVKIYQSTTIGVVIIHQYLIWGELGVGRGRGSRNIILGNKNKNIQMFIFSFWIYKKHLDLVQRFYHKS